MYYLQPHGYRLDRIGLGLEWIAIVLIRGLDFWVHGMFGVFLQERNRTEKPSWYTFWVSPEVLRRGFSFESEVK